MCNDPVFCIVSQIFLIVQYLLQLRLKPQSHKSIFVSTLKKFVYFYFAYEHAK